MTHIFIVNPHAGQKTFADDLRAKLANIEGLNYFVFNTRYAGYETELVRKIQHIFEGEKLRFYCCGGSGTMRKMLSGFENIEEAEVAFFPCGLANDFLKVFGKDEKRFHQIEELINGEVIKVDYIQTNHGVALNTFSTGFDADYVTLFDKYRMLSVFNEQIPYSLAVLCSLFVSRHEAYEVCIDDEKQLEGSFSEIIFGNGNVLGGNMYFYKDINYNDDYAGCCMIPNMHSLKLLPLLLALKKQDYDEIETKASCFKCKNIRIVRKDGAPFSMNLDGEIIHNIKEWSAHIVHEGLRFVVPKGVSL